MSWKSENLLSEQRTPLKATARWQCCIKLCLQKWTATKQKKVIFDMTHWICQAGFCLFFYFWITFRCIMGNIDAVSNVWWTAQSILFSRLESVRNFIIFCLLCVERHSNVNIFIYKRRWILVIIHALNHQMPSEDIGFQWATFFMCFSRALKPL